METKFFDLDNIENLGDTAVCLGFFDALHTGHQALIKAAKKTGKKVALVSMEPGPKEFFGHEKNYHVNTLEDKEELLPDFGVDYYVVFRADAAFYGQSPEEFVENVLLKLGARAVVCGFDFTYGKMAKGNAETLKNTARGRFDVIVCNPVRNEEGIKISSTYVKSLIEDGEVEKVNRYLPRPYQVKAPVLKGNQIGRTIGFPTANLANQEDYIYPKTGVYGGLLRVDGKTYKTMINVGTHPTVKQLKKRIIEAHVLDAELDLYGKEVTVVFLKFLRGEKKFAGLEDLKKQLESDKDTIRKSIELN